MASIALPDTATVMKCILTKMLRQSTCRLSCAILALVVVITAKPPPGPSSWATYGAGKSVYTKSLGPPGGLDTITVPYGPKTPSFFPKFVDPKTMISSKTDFLNNLFGGMGPVSYPFTAPVLYASKFGDESNYEIPELGNIIPTDYNDGKNIKRSMFGPMSGKFGPIAPPSKPFASKFLSEPNSPFLDTKSEFDAQSRRKRSALMAPAPPTNFGPPPPYPGLSSIVEEAETDIPTSSSGFPKQVPPYFFGPFAPSGFAPPSPIIDPSFFTSKKSAFLNTLFSSLATSTPATATDIPVTKNTIVPPGFWSPMETATAIPIPKSTIVPPGFWAPSSIIPTPGEYTDKVTKFLNKLVESIQSTKIDAATDETEPKSNFVRSLVADSSSKTKVSASIEDLATITAAKDAIVDSIIAELGSLKTDMINNLDELILAEKSEVAKASSGAAAVGKKPMKPSKAAFAGFWGSPVPSSDPFLPFKQKMSTLSQVFDLLTELQKNITIAVTDAINSRATATVASSSRIVDPPDQMTAQTYNNYMPPSQSVPPSMNISFWDALKSKLASFDEPTMKFGPSKYARTLTKDPAPLWPTYSQDNTVKRHVDDRDYDSQDDNQHGYDSQNDFKRAVKMSMHQGYQSMPPGTVESVQAGGGSVPGHQGGGIKLLNSQSTHDDESWNDWAKWGEYIQDRYKEQRLHHHNHH